jgi:thiol:disulfide interchange protein
MKKTAILIFTLIFVIGNVFSQSDLIKFQAFPSKLKVEKDEKFEIKINASVKNTWYTYSFKEQLNKEGIGPTQSDVTIEPKDLIIKDGNIKAPKPKTKYDSAFYMNIEIYKGNFSYVIPVKALKKIDFAKDKIIISNYMQLCDPQRCIPPEDYKVTVSNKLENGNTEEKAEELVEVAQVIKKDSAQPKQEIKQGESNPAVVTESNKEIDKAKKAGVWSFLWLAMTMGALSLLTPCVFPMVPITVSFFTKRAEKSKGNGLRDSLIYALGIITTFTALGFILASVFSATGIQDFAANPWVNFAIAAVFIIFALNLFGAFEIQIPTSILNKLNAKSQGNGIVSVLLMGLTFSLTSFTCTVPFVGSALFSASQGEWFYPIIGMIGFSAVFAAPFFLLALFPSRLQKLPKAGGWMNNLKVVMGFLEIAAAIKFISSAEFVLKWGILPREMFLAIWIACAFLIVIYILGIFRLHHDSPIQSIGSGRIIFSLLFATIGFYLVSGLFGKPLGELDAYFPPPDYQQIINSDGTTGAAITTGKGSESSKSEELHWIEDYKAGIEEAKKTGKPIFVDFTGFTCTNCRWMEVNMFKKPDVSALLEKYVLIRLYTDKKQEPYISNKNMQMEKYKSIEQPLYVIMTSDEKLITTKAFTRDQNEFINFLKEGLK